MTENKKLTKQQQALQTFEDLIKSCLCAGAFKSFDTLDQCREAYKVLQEFVEENVPAE